MRFIITWFNNRFAIHETGRSIIKRINLKKKQQSRFQVKPMCQNGIAITKLHKSDTNRSIDR